METFPTIFNVGLQNLNQTNSYLIVRPQIVLFLKLSFKDNFNFYTTAQKKKSLMFRVHIVCMYVCEFIFKTLNFHIHLTVKTNIYQYNSRKLLFEAFV